MTPSDHTFVVDLRHPLDREAWLSAFMYSDGFEAIDEVRKKAADLINHLSLSLKEAERERDELRAALQKIVDNEPDRYAWAVDVARAALQPKDTQNG